MTIKKVKEQIEKKESELKDLRSELRELENEDSWLEIPEKGIKITTKLQFTNKTYPEILEEVDESEIADYDLLQELRNKGFNSKWKEYAFLKKFWAFVPNPDEVSKSNGYVARFCAYSDGAGLDCFEDSGGSNSALGVFLVKKISKTKNESKENN